MPPERDDERNPAASFAAAWRRAAPELEAERLKTLRARSEEDSARCFAELLTPGGQFALRSSSGLVEQMRILDRLRAESR